MPRGIYVRTSAWRRALSKRSQGNRYSKRLHGHARGKCTPTYESWSAMKSRCNNPNHDSWKNYGGRGITVCDRWLHSFENFLADMGERPEGKTLDRFPNRDGNYEPSNCRWATVAEQNANRRNQHQLLEAAYQRGFSAGFAARKRILPYLGCREDFNEQRDNDPM